MMPTYFVCSPVSSSSLRISEKPTIAFIGVLISWLIFARNRLLDSFAASASFLACLRAFSASLRSITSFSNEIFCCSVSFILSRMASRISEKLRANTPISSLPFLSILWFKLPLAISDEILVSVIIGRVNLVITIDIVEIINVDITNMIDTRTLYIFLESAYLTLNGTVYPTNQSQLSKCLKVIHLCCPS